MAKQQVSMDSAAVPESPFLALREAQTPKVSSQIKLVSSDFFSG